LWNHEKQCLDYYGPHESRSRIQEQVLSEQMLHGIYVEICKGNTQNVVNRLANLGLDICTMRSPFGGDSLVEVVMNSKNGLDTFQSLMAVEPRIVTIGSLTTAVLLERGDIVGILLEAGVNVMERVDADCLSILHFALDHKVVRSGRLVELLVSAGMDIPALDALDPFLAHVCGNAQPSVVRHLCEAGASVNVEVNGVPLLHHWMGKKAVGRYYQHIAILVSFGYDINIRLLRSRTPLMAATMCNDVPSVRELISHGADVNARCSSGYTAADLLKMATPHAFRVHVQDVLNALNGE
jgi:hypothetical protein